MANGLIQLVAYGAQDIYLTGNPNITFFKTVYRRYTNFATESIEQFFTNNLNFGKRSQCEITRNGDLITKMYLRMVFPEVRYCGPLADKNHVVFAWVRRLGHAVIDEMELEIGGTEIDKQYGTWLNIWYELTNSVGKRSGYDRMIGDVPELTELSTLDAECPDNFLKPRYVTWVPFYFYCCEQNGLALPLIALQYHQVRIYVKLHEAHRCYIASKAFKTGCKDDLCLEDVSLYVDYVYLDTVERRRMAQVSHEYLIQQLQFGGPESINNANTAKYKLNFNHPCKALYWVTKLGNYRGGVFMSYVPYDWQKARIDAAEKLILAQFDLENYGYFNSVPQGVSEDGYIAESIPYIGISPLDPAYEALFVFNDSETRRVYEEGQLIGYLAPDAPLLKRRGCPDFRCKVQGVIRLYTDYDNNCMVYPEVERVTLNNLNIADLSVPIEKFEEDNRCEYIRGFDVCVWQHQNYGLFIDGTVNPVTDVLIQLNGQDRLSKRESFYYDTIQPWQCFTDTPISPINVYSFALEPVKFQPSGTCNFSRIDTATLGLTFGEFTNNKCADIFIGTDNQVCIFVNNYNVLRIMSGMGGLAYQN